MPTFQFSREVILSAIRANVPKQQVEHPGIPVFQRSVVPLKPEFEQHLQQAGAICPKAASTLPTFRSSHGRI
jgi:hypothetical protein